MLFMEELHDLYKVLEEKSVRPIFNIFAEPDKGPLAATKYNPHDPGKPVIIVGNRSTHLDVAHELAHCLLSVEGYPRTYTAGGDDRSNEIASTINSVVEHGQVVAIGKQFGFDLRLDNRQYEVFERRLSEGRIDLEIDALNYADATIRCSDIERWNKIDEKYFQTKYPEIRKIALKILKTVRRYGNCETADQARGCFHAIAKLVALKHYEMYAKPQLLFKL